MTERVLTLIDEITQLRQQYVAEVGRGGRKAWPRSIKDRIFELSGLGIKAKEIAAKTQIPTDTIHMWNYQLRREKGQDFKELMVVPQKNSKLVTVTVTRNKKKPKQEKVVTVMVTTPEGYRIEGLNTEALIALLLKLRGSNAF